MEPLKGGDDYIARLDFLTQQPEFETLTQKEKGATIAKFRDDYLSDVEDESSIRVINSLSTSKSDYIKGDRYRVEADDFIKAGLEYPAIAGQPKEKAIENINKFRQQIDERSNAFDPVFRDDYVFDLKRLADEEERAVRGEGVGRVTDLHNRYVKGWTGALMRGVGMTETADKFELEYFPVNPEYDEKFLSKTFTAGGDAVATVGIVLGASAVAGPWAGAGAGLATNATRKYQDAYRQEFDASGNAELAHQAGLASTPGAALETAGEMLIAGRFSKLLPKGFRKEFLSAPNSAAKSEVVRKALAETSTRAKLGAVAFNSLQEGVSEVSGDFVSGLGSAQVTGRDSFVPTGAEAAETFAISAIIGAGFGGVEAGMRRPDAALKGQQQNIKSLLDKGDFQGVENLVGQRIVETARPTKDTPMVPERPQLKPAMKKAEQAVDNGAVTNAVTNERGERIKVDERTAKIHDSLIDSLTGLSNVDDLNALPEGNKKGGRYNPVANNKRAVELKAIKEREEQLNIELPERARLFSELDKVGEEVVNIKPEQIADHKRLIDAAALTSIQYGMDPNTVYGGISFRVDQTTEQAKAVARRGKVRSVQDTFNRESEQLGLPTDVQAEVDELVGSVDTGMLEQARKQDVREHFAPEAFKQFEQKRVGWKEVLVDMPIDEYLSLAEPIKPNENKMSEVQDGGPGLRTSEDNAAALKELIEQGSMIPDLPQLFLDDAQQDVRVTGHEGRHRAMALKALGYDTMPVVLNTRKIRWSEQGEGGRNPDYYRLTDEQWPTKLISEKGDVTIDFPVDREGNYGRKNNSISSQDELFQYAGRRANLTPQQELNRQKAIEMLDAGKDEETVRLATGWFPGKYDGKLRWEIDDSQAKLTEDFSSMEETALFSQLNPKLLSEVLNHKELFSAYPELADVQVIRRKGFLDIFGALQGSFDPERNLLNVTPNAVDPLSTMLHEIQHWIQTKEGFASGGNEQSSIEALSDQQKNNLIELIKQKSENLISEINQKATEVESEISLIDAIDAEKFEEATKELRAAESSWETAYQLRNEDLKDLAYKRISAAKDKIHSAITDEKYISGTKFFDLYITAAANKKVITLDDLKSAKKLEVARLAADAQDAKMAVENISDNESLKKVLQKFGLGYELYTRLAGEIEARDTQARQPLTKEQRTQTEPYSSEQISEDHALVTFRSPGITNSISSQQLPVNGQPYFGRFFHGGSFAGGQIKASKDGSLGAGYYFTTQDRAAGYAKTSGSTQQEIQDGSVRAFDILLDKPLVVNMDGQPNFVEGLIFEVLGMPREKAFEKAEKIIEEKGFISKHFQTLGRKLGYDGIIQLRDGKVSEMVAWSDDSLTDLGNADQLNNELMSDDEFYAETRLVNYENKERWIENNPEKYEALKQKKIQILANRGFDSPVIYNGFRYYPDEHPGHVYSDGKVNNVGATSLGFYFSDDKNLADDYAEQKLRDDERVGSVNEVVVNFKNPLKLPERISPNDLIKLLTDSGITVPDSWTDRWQWYSTMPMSQERYVWKLINPSHLSRSRSFGMELVDAIRNAGFDGIIHPDKSGVMYEVSDNANSYIVFPDEANRIKSIDPLSFDDDGILIPPSEWGREDSDSILYQKTVQDLWRNLTPAKAAPRTLQVGNSLQSASSVVEQFLAKTPTVTAKNGRRVQLHHAKQGSIDILVQHLSTREDGSFDARRAMHTSRIPHTLQNAEIVATDEKTKNVLYFARYRDKTPGRPGQKSREFDNVHVVLVKPDGTLANHGEITEDVWTQFVRDFADGPAKTQGAMPAELLQSMGLVDGPLEAPNRSGGDMSVQSLNPTTPADATSASVGGITTVDGITEQPSTANAVSPAPSTLTGATKFADAFSVEVDSNSKLSQSQGENFVNLLFGGKPNKPKGRIQFQNEDGSIAPLNVPIDQLDNKLKAIITISRTSGDISTFHHEVMHYLHRSGILAGMLSGQELENFERAAGLGADRIWRVENYEAVARAYEGWLRNPLLPFEGKIRVPAILERVFRKISSAMSNIYKSLRDSGLPFEEKGGRAVPNIHPDFRVAFERLYSFDPSIRFTKPDIELSTPSKPKTGDQNASQLPSVNRQLIGSQAAVSPQQTPKKATDAQLSAKQEDDKYERDAQDRLNIKLVHNMKPKHRLDQAVVAAFKAVADLSAGLHLDKELAGLYYAILDNFAVSRRINKSSKREQSLRRPAGAFVGEDADPIKDPGDPAYSDSVIKKLNEIRDTAYKLWFDQYKARNPEALKDVTADDFGSKLDVVKYNAEQKEKKSDSESDEELSARRQSINDNVAQGQAALRLRKLEDLPGADLPNRFEPLKRTIERYYEFLKSVDVTTEELNDRDAFKVQLYLDALLNDDTLLGLAEFAKHEMMAKLGEATGLEKYRAAYSKFGLVGILAAFGKDISETITGLRLTSINIEAIARTDAARNFLNNVLIDDYYDAVTKAQVLKHEYKAFLKATREKHFGKYGNDPLRMNTAGIISKIMQAPIDLNRDQLIEALKNNVTQLRQGFTNEAERGGVTGKHAGQLKIKLLDQILAGLPEEFDQEQFINHVQETFPAETGYVLDNIDWIAENLTAGSQMVVEGLYATQFNPQGYYLPTKQVHLDPPKADEIELDGSFFENQYGGDKFTAQNPVTVKRSGSLQERTGYLSDKERSTYNTNLEYVLEEAVNGIIMDIYTGFERKKLGYLLNTSKQTPGSLRAQFEEMLSTENNDGADAVKHLRKTIHDMVSTDLGQHRYINQLEALTSLVRKNIAPAMLSSLHQAVTQPLSQFVSHITRRRELTQYYVSALKLAMDHTLGNAPASFNVMFERHLSERAPAPDYLLAKGQSIPRTTPLDKLGDYVIGQIGIDKKSFVETRNKAKLIDGAVKDGLLFGLRFGDMFSAKVIFAAELLHAAKQEQGITDAAKVEYDRIKPATMTKIMNVMDEAINASRNSRRGTILAHPGVVLSMLSIFAGHRISVASATGLRIRNAIELSMDGNFKDGMLGDSAKYVLATVLQSITFSALKWGVLGMLVKGLYQAMTPEDDDDRHWLYGEMEREEVEDIRKLTEDRYESSFGPNTLGTAVMRDLFGNVFLTWAFGGIDNTFFTMADLPLKENFNEGKKEALDQIDKQLKQRRDLLTEAEIADLNAQYEAIEKTKFVPMGFKNFGSDDFGGALGASLQPAMDFANAANESAFTSKKMSIEDFALFMRLFGYGQPELTRALKILAKKKDTDAERVAEDEELNEYDF